VLGGGSPLEEVDEGGGERGDVADTAVFAGGWGACVCTPLGVVVAPVAAVAPAAGLLLPLPLPLPLPSLLMVELELELLLLLPLLAVALVLELDDDLKEERRFWAEDFRRIEGRRTG
jgi:hypothetical protein